MSKLKNLTKNDWKETNEQSNKDRGVSGITYADIYGEERIPHIAEALDEVEKMLRGDLPMKSARQLLKELREETEDMEE